MKKITFTWPNGITIIGRIVHQRLHKSLGLKTVIECLATGIRYIIYGKCSYGLCDYQCAVITEIE